MNLQENSLFSFYRQFLERSFTKEVMKKHFTGIALFIFIVGISGFVASLFVEIPKTEVFEITEIVPRYMSKKKCSKKYTKSDNHSVSVKINQAVYDEKTKLLYTDYSVKSISLDSVSINLHFFIKTANKIQYLTTEETSLKLIFQDGGSSSGSENLSVKLLNDLSSHENIYVIAEPFIANGGASGGVRNIPVFNKSKATAVLVAKD